MDYGRIDCARKTGEERFTAGSTDLGFDLATFWQWSTSDLVNNVTRGRLAEYLVARALGLGVDDIREEWAPYDILSPDGVKIEVKSAAYIQSWAQTKLSPIQFLVPKTRGWNADTSVMEVEARRQADVYVFALLAHTDQESINPLNVNQWRFYVLHTDALNSRTRSQHSITLASLETLAGGWIGYSHLGEAISAVAWRKRL
jgi:hypothetical protein